MTKQDKFYIYFHINPLKNEVFYVGKGKGNRAFLKGKRRSSFWHNIVNKHGLIVDIVEQDLSEEQAFEREKYYIKKIGRRDLGLGSLVNMTDGGEGQSGRKQSEEEIKKRVAKLIGHKFNVGRKQSEEEKKRRAAKMIGHKVSEEARKIIGEKNKINMLGKRNSPKTEFKKGQTPHNKGKKASPEMVNKMKGRIISEETREKMSQSRKGQTAWNKGKKMSSEQRLKLEEKGFFKKGKIPPNRKKVINSKGIIFDSVKIASEAYNIKMQNLSRMLRGIYKNKTDLSFFKETQQI